MSKESTIHYSLLTIHSAKHQLYYARLYTDKKFREAEFRKNIFSESEKSDIIFFAQSLINKRRGVVAVLIPETKELLGDNFVTVFQEYAESNSMKKGVLKHYWDTYFLLSFVLNKYKDHSLNTKVKNEQKKILYAFPVLPWLFLRHPKYYLERLIRLIIR